MNKSEALFERAKKVIPGGVNSPVRAFNSVGGNPIFMKESNGSKIIDEDGNEYIDYVGSWGPMIIGHRNEKVIERVSKAIESGLSFGAATKLEVEMAETITNIVKPLEMVRMVNSGTEAVMSVLRLARAYTKRDKIIKFAGCYHGHVDSMLVKAGSGAMTNSMPDSDGITLKTVEDTLIAEYNDLQSVEKLILDNRNEIAGIIVEPVAANMGVVLPSKEFLAGLRKLCDENNILLIFDEVITGFRLSLGGAQEYFNIESDLVTYGKIIGGGMPVGAYGGRREIMKNIAPIGKVYQAGTLSGNPIAMTAGLATLEYLKSDSKFYINLNKKSNEFFESLKNIKGTTINSIGSIGTLFFNDVQVKDYNSALLSDRNKYANYFNRLIENGVYVAPSQFEAMFIGEKHTKEDLAYTIKCMEMI